MGADFRSIELEVYSDSDLAELAEALDRKVGTNYCGPTQDGRPWAYSYAGSFLGIFDDDALLKSIDSSQPLDQGIEQFASGFCDVLDRLGHKAKGLWDSAGERVFDVGLDANLKRIVIINFLSPETMNRLAGLGIRLAVSVYALDIESEMERLKAKGES